MINMGLNEVLDLKECLEDIIEDMDPDHLSGMLSLCAPPPSRTHFAGNSGGQTEQACLASDVMSEDALIN